MSVERCAIPDVLVLRPQKISDHRGFLVEAWNRRTLADAGVAIDFVQENIAVSPAPFTVRGLHFQAPPHAQAKLMRAQRGRARYAVVDLRRASASYGHNLTFDLDAATHMAVFTPVGFAHGIVTQLPDTEIAYHVSAHHSSSAERAIRWNDPDLAIDWGLGLLVDASPKQPAHSSGVLLSEKDANAQAFRSLESPFN